MNKDTHHSGMLVAGIYSPNYGFRLQACRNDVVSWDRLYGTYRVQPRKGHEAMMIGIHQYNQPEQVTWLHKMLLLPFIGKVTEYAINSRYKSSE